MDVNLWVDTFDDYVQVAELDPEVIQWVSAFASCAIEGNQTARRMVDLWNNGDRRQFLIELEDWQSIMVQGIQPDNNKPSTLSSKKM